MDAQARKKALYRAKLNASKQEKRIESPLVRYNESDQPVCVVCNVVLKSESIWPAHQVSRKHHEAINNMKASAAGQAQGNSVKPELAKPKPALVTELRDAKPEVSHKMPKARSSSGLPPNFFDNNEPTKKQKTGKETTNTGNASSYKKPEGSAQTQITEVSNSESKKDILSNAKALESKTHETKIEREPSHTPKEVTGSESKYSKGALPEGFFDDKDKDLRARGIKPVKPDPKDEYKEFEKLIQEDLKEVDNRMEEEEFDAAEMIEEAETVEQKSYWERVEMLRKKKMEIVDARKKKTGRMGTSSQGSQVSKKESNPEKSSSDDDSDDNFTVDWRAKKM